VVLDAGGPYRKRRHQLFARADEHLSDARGRTQGFLGCYRMGYPSSFGCNSHNFG
jgi:hypothetical protein